MISIILCEEIRNEVNGVKSLIGVFSPEGVKVANVPYVFPKFAMFTTVKNEGDNIFTFEVIDPKGAVSLKGDFPKVVKETEYIQYALNISPLIFKEFGGYTFVVKRNDGRSANYLFNIKKFEKVGQVKG
jgi:hypothetical protein